MSAIFSPCGRYRYQLARDISPLLGGVTLAFFGVNPSTAGADEDDATTRKMIGFAERLNARKYILGNAFAWISTDVHELAYVEDPFGPENHDHIGQIIRAADVLIPCWGSRTKLPRKLHGALDVLEARLARSGKPLRAFGVTKSGDPMHPLMLGYETKLMEWMVAA